MEKLKFRVGKGRGSVNLAIGLEGFVEEQLRLANGAAFEFLEEAMTEVVQKAKPKWPVRLKGRSQDSRNKFQIGIRLLSKNMIEGYITNTAKNPGQTKPYWFQIHAGEESKTPVPQGAQVAKKLIAEPLYRYAYSGWAGGKELDKKMARLKRTGMIKTEMKPRSI